MSDSVPAPAAVAEAPARRGKKAAAPVAAREMTLYEATDALAILDDLIAEHADAIAAAGGDLEAVPAIAELLAFGEGVFEAKIERVALKALEFERTADAIGAEVDRLTARKRAAANRATWLRAYAKRHLDARGVTKVAGELVSVRVQANPPAVAAASDLVLEELFVAGSPFVTRLETYKLDRDAVLAAYKAGEALPEGVVVSVGSSLRIA